MKNEVIKVLDPEHGKKVIEYWISKGIDTSGYSGSFSEATGANCIYYGVIDRKFDNYSYDRVINMNATIIELPVIPECQFQIGDTVEIVLPGKTHDTYMDKFFELKFKNEIQNPPFNIGDVGVVFGITTTKWNSILIAVRHKDGSECLINKDGVKLIEKKEKVMETQKLTRPQVKEIYDIACDRWKNKLTDYVGNQCAYTEFIEFDAELVEEMFNAATASQLPVLEKLLTRPESIKFNKTYVYIFKGAGFNSNIYKLQRVGNSKYAWVWFYGTDAYANGTFDSPEAAIKSYTKDSIIVLKSKTEVINYFKSL